jgi:hypothetical protein
MVERQLQFIGLHVPMLKLAPYNPQLTLVITP